MKWPRTLPLTLSSLYILCRCCLPCHGFLPCGDLSQAFVGRRWTAEDASSSLYFAWQSSKHTVSTTQVLSAWMDNLSEQLVARLDSFSSFCKTVLTFEKYCFWVAGVSLITYPAGSCPSIPWDDGRSHRHRPGAATLVLARTMWPCGIYLSHSLNNQYL